MDLGDVRRVVQYMIPRKLTQWTQHAGRCGRDGEPAIAILLVEPSVFQKVRKRQKKDPNASKEKKKSSTTKKPETTKIKVEEVEADIPLNDRNQVRMRFTILPHDSNL